MSTPSTATATLPPPHHRYYSRHQQAFGHQVTPSYGSIVKNTPRLPQPQFNPSYSTSSDKKLGIRLPPPSPAFYTPEAMNGSGRSRTQKATKHAKQPDWEEFYKNGVPEEVIVIDDDDDNTPDSHLGINKSDISLDRPDKKRKTGPSSNYDPVYNPQPSYSTTHTPYYDNSSANHTASTDRTAPLYKGSSSSGPTVANGTNYYASYDEGVVGQKRKRTTRAVEDLKVTKRREIEKIQSPFSAYVPPPKPPHKARDVYVKIIKDVSNCFSSTQVSLSLTVSRLLEIKIQRLLMTMTVITVLNQILTSLQNVSIAFFLSLPLANSFPDKIIKLLGQGTFGKVVEAWDRENNTKCAVKVIRSVQKYRDASRIELRVLSTLKQNDKDNRNKCIHLRDCFDFRNHICIVTDLYGQSVFDFLKGNSFTPFPSSHIQLFARQLLTSVACKCFGLYLLETNLTSLQFSMISISSIPT
jgi:dual-specificity kinase